jgi:single-stranded-DNA-specific exonuclease
MNKRWLHKEIPSSDDIQKLSDAINTNPYLTAILLQRGISDFGSAHDFFKPSLDKLHDPFLMKDMDVAVERLHRAITNEEKILIYGDYDVDGTTAVSLVYSFLTSFYKNCALYLPNRYA